MDSFGSAPPDRQKKSPLDFTAGWQKLSSHPDTQSAGRNPSTSVRSTEAQLTLKVRQLLWIDTYIAFSVYPQSSVVKVMLPKVAMPSNSAQPCALPCFYLILPRSFSRLALLKCQQSTPTLRFKIKCTFSRLWFWCVCVQSVAAVSLLQDTSTFELN